MNKVVYFIYIMDNLKMSEVTHWLNFQEECKRMLEEEKVHYLCNLVG